METKIIKSDDKNLISEAAKAVFNGEIAAFPTETVYGLGGNALLEESAFKIYSAKGRPLDNPLIVHIAEFNQVYDIAEDIPESFLKLAKHFWPGPLTMILKKKALIPDSVTAKLDTVAIRFPKNETAQFFIKSAGCPIAAPSANISGLVSPTKAEYVYDDFNGKIPYIIDGGDCEEGLESTVITLAGDTPVILRPGSITFEQIREILPDVKLHDSLINSKTEVVNPASPGMKYKHYSPKAEVYLLSGDFENQKNFIAENADDEACGFVFKEFGLDIKNTFSLGSRKNLREMGTKVFSLMREADKKGYKKIYIPAISEDNIGLAIMNRLKKAAGGKFIKL